MEAYHTSFCSSVVVKLRDGHYRDNLTAILISDNFLPIIVIAQNSLDLSITDIAFAIYRRLLCYRR